MNNLYLFCELLRKHNRKKNRTRKSPKSVSRLLKRGPVKVLNDAKMSPSKFLDSVENALGYLLHQKNAKNLQNIVARRTN